VPKSVKGTIAYLAPEVVLAQFNKSNYDGRLSDVWSCGVMLYIMLFGSYPFQDGANQQFNRTVKVRGRCATGHAYRFAVQGRDMLPWQRSVGLCRHASLEGISISGAARSPLGSLEACSRRNVTVLQCYSRRGRA
jgi:serine/threonine protein kinase